MRCALLLGTAILLVLAAVPAQAAEAEAAGASVAARLDKARDAARDAKRRDEAVRLCEDVIASAEAAPKDKVAAFRILMDVRREQKKPQEALDLAKRLRDAMPDDPGAAAAAHLGVGRVLYDDRKFAEAYDEAAKAAELDARDDPVTAEALWLMVEAAWNGEGLVEKALAPNRRVLEDRFLSTFDVWRRRGMQQRLVEVLRRLKRYDEARAFCDARQKAEQEKPLAQDWCRLVGDLFMDQEQYAEAAKAYERVFLDYPDTTNYWYEAQRRIAEALMKQGRLDEALGAARVALDASHEEGRIAENVRTIAEILKGLNGHVGRANAFINFQRFGPAGEDGQPGTADDLADPLAALPRPSYPEREKAFAGARRQAGDDSRAMRLRAYTYIYSGKPVQALRCFLDAFGRCMSDELQERGTEMIVIGARAVRGHAVGLEAFFDFVNYGPAGPDGKTGTADDREDPFAPLLK